MLVRSLLQLHCKTAYGKIILEVEKVTPMWYLEKHPRKHFPVSAAKSLSKNLTRALRYHREITLQGSLAL